MIVMVLCCVAVIEFLPADVSQPRAVGQLELSDLPLFAGSMDANVSKPTSLPSGCHLGSCVRNFV
jgi:hypothetical protein